MLSHVLWLLVKAVVPWQSKSVKQIFQSVKWNEPIPIRRASASCSGCASAATASGITGRGGERRESLKQHPWLGRAWGCGMQQICSNTKPSFMAKAVGFPVTLDSQHPLQVQSYWCVPNGLIFPVLLPTSWLSWWQDKDNVYLPCPSSVYVHGVLTVRGKGTLYTFKWVGEHTLS